MSNRTAVPLGPLPCHSVDQDGRSCTIRGFHSEHREADYGSMWTDDDPWRAQPGKVMTFDVAPDQVERLRSVLFGGVEPSPRACGIDRPA